MADFRNPASLRIIDREGERGPKNGERLFEKPATGEINVAELRAAEAARAPEQLFHGPTQSSWVGALKTLYDLLPQPGEWHDRQRVTLGIQPGARN
jgi:hypothetical protein